MAFIAFGGAAAFAAFIAFIAMAMRLVRGLSTLWACAQASAKMDTDADDYNGAHGVDIACKIHSTGQNHAHSGYESDGTP